MPERTAQRLQLACRAVNRALARLGHVRIESCRVDDGVPVLVIAPEDFERVTVEHEIGVVVDHSGDGWTHFTARLDGVLLVCTVPPDAA